MVTTACGRFSSKHANSPTSEPGEIGGGFVQLSNPTTTVAATTTKPTTRSAPTTATETSGCDTRNANSLFNDGRLKIAMTTSSTCPAHRDDITFTMAVTNVSSTAVHYDANQLLRFSVRAPAGQSRRRWEDDDCATPPADRTKPALDLQPGQSVSFASLYPGPKDFANREACRTLEVGAYEVRGVFLVCDASYQDGYCNISQDTQVEAAPIPITLGA
ncbi:MAG: hypothetical protein QOJ00_695 [Actinomycetota bacterium]